MNKEEKFHKSRIAFLIIDGNILYLENSGMGHLEWYLSLGYPIDNFNNIVRGYLKDDRLVYYKGDFDYDEEVIETAILTENIIKEHCNNLDAITYCGVTKGEIGESWPPKAKLSDLIEQQKNGYIRK